MFSTLNQPANPGVAPGMLLLTALALGIVWALIVLIELVVLQLLRWGNFRQALRASAIMNAISSVVGLVLLLAFPQPSVWGLLGSGALAGMIETAVLVRLRRGDVRENAIAALVANLASYLVLVLPAYLFRG